MKVIIQCAATKRPNATSLRTAKGENVVFVADVNAVANKLPGIKYARPDDPCGAENQTWRDVLEKYNKDQTNRFNLSRAADLYAPNEYEYRCLYRDLADTFGSKNVFILSAGWGLIQADFLTPDYNITFSSQAKKKKPWVWRNPAFIWSDFNHLLDADISPYEEVHFFGGTNYLPHYYAFTRTLPGKMIIHHKSAIEHLETFQYEAYHGPEKSRTWHYRVALEFCDSHRRTSR